MFVNPLNPGIKQQSFGSLPIPTNQPVSVNKSKKPPDQDLPRYLNFIADYTGCGHWRMLWPEHVLNAYRQCVIQSSTVMVTDPKYFHGVTCIRVQRQANESQRGYLKFLKEQMGVRLIYEIDDICFGEDIPKWNAFRDAFTDERIRNNIQSMMEYCDEMTVTCQSMKNYFLKKTSQKNITVIPNYPTKTWIGRFYDPKKVSIRFEKNTKKPRIMYAGSSSHFDLQQKNNLQDDITHVIDAIKQTVDKYQWVFMGGIPLQLKEFIDKNKIEYHPWVHLHEYPYKVSQLNIDVMVAPLQNNIFNKCKSEIKFLEAAALGIPMVAQDMITYERCKNKFTTGSQMLSQIQEVLSSKKKYMSLCERNYSIVDKMWLENENNRAKYFELYKYNYGHQERTNINKINGHKKDS